MKQSSSELSKNSQTAPDRSQTSTMPQEEMSPAAKVRQQLRADLLKLSEARLNALAELATALAKKDREYGGR